MVNKLKNHSKNIFQYNIRAGGGVEINIHPFWHLAISFKGCLPIIWRVNIRGIGLDRLRINPYSYQIIYHTSLTEIEFKTRPENF